MLEVQAQALAQRVCAEEPAVEAAVAHPQRRDKRAYAVRVCLPCKSLVTLVHSTEEWHSYRAAWYVWLHPDEEPFIPERIDDKKSPPKKGNPCIALYGPGPDGVKCRDCEHMYHIQRGGQTRWKCALRKTVNAETDHRLQWPACAKFEPVCVTSRQEESAQSEAYHGG